MVSDVSCDSGLFQLIFFVTDSQKLDLNSSLWFLSVGSGPDTWVQSSTESQFSSESLSTSAKTLVQKKTFSNNPGLCGLRRVPSRFWSELDPGQLDQDHCLSFSEGTRKTKELDLSRGFWEEARRQTARFAE